MPLPTNTSLLQPLTGIRRSLLRRAIGQNCADGLGAAAGIFVLLELWQLGFNVTENAAGIAAAAGLLLVAVVFLVRHARLLLRQPGPAQLALAIENARPELLDAFVCAVELEQKRASGQLRPMEENLLADIQRQYAGDDAFFAAIFRTRLSWRRPLLHAAAAIALAVIAARGGVLAKATYCLRDLLTGKDTGITVELPATEMPAGSDARILATVHRWEKQAEIIYADGNGDIRLPMPPTQDGRFAFTFYSLADSVRFRIVTPALTSRWHELPVFTPPAIDAVAITVTPLAYTGRAVQTFDAFTDIGLIAGETLTVAIQAPLATDAWLLTEANANAQSFQSAGNGRLELTSKPMTTGQRQVRLQDAAGHHVDGQPFMITVSPDLPPIIELRAPEQDTQLKPGDAVRLSAFAGDDFGIKAVTLQFSVNGGSRQSVRLWDNNGADRQPEVEYSEIWDIPGLKLEEGDLISAQVIAADNREPEPQFARSELFFIVIRPEQKTAEADGASGPQKKMDISDLLAESKRLLRLTWDVLALADAPRARAAGDLVRGVRELELEVRRRFNTIQEESQGLVAEPLPTLFATCSHELNQAAALLERDLPEESIGPQERSLAALVKIETELLRNAMKSKKPQEGDDDSKGEKKEQQQQQSDPSSQSEQARQHLEKMRAMLENLRRLVPRQEKVNESAGQPGAILPALAGKQDAIGADAAAIRSELATISEAARAAATVRNSEQEMTRAAVALQTEDARTGGIHGARARLQLLAAIRQLEDAIRKASAHEIAKLAEQAAQLSEAQKQAAAQSEQAAAQSEQADPAAARTQQEKLNQMTEQLQERLRQTADGIQKDFPDAAQALREAGRQAQSRGLPESQQRAQNALLYKRFDRAAKEQTDAANYLQALANDLHEAGGKLPPMSEEDLRDALRRLQELASQTDAARRDQNQPRARQQLEQIRADAAQTLQPFADAFKDQRLQQITDDMSMPTGEESPSAAGELLFRQFRAAATVLEQLLGKMAVDRKVQLHRDVVTPPEKYQRQVEEYFKGLGQD